MPVHQFPELRLAAPDLRAELRSMPGTEVPVIRQPYQVGDRLPFWAPHPSPSASHLFDVEADPGELEDRAGSALEGERVDALATELRRIEAPADLLERIGVA